MSIYDFQIPFCSIPYAGPRRRKAAGPSQIEQQQIAAVKPVRSPVNLRPVNRPTGHNRYCGPAVISIVSGIDTNEAAERIRRYSGQRAVKGSSTVNVRRVMQDLGVQTERLNIASGQFTLAGLMRRLNAEKRLSSGRAYLVVAGNHFQIVPARRYICGITGDFVSIRDKKVKRRARVAGVYEIYR